MELSHKNVCAERNFYYVTGKWRDGFGRCITCREPFPFVRRNEGAYVYINKEKRKQELKALGITENDKYYHTYL